MRVVISFRHVASAYNVRALIDWLLSVY